MEYEFEKYKCLSENLKETLEKYGVAIIPNLINDIECYKMLSGTWNFFEHITSSWDEPIDQYDVDTWDLLFELDPNFNMLYSKWNVGHSQHSWDLRQNPKIVDIFAKFWNTEQNDLLVSFDGLSFLPPPEFTWVGYDNQTEPWFHIDQSITRPNFEGIQSFITALDVNEKDATLCVYEGSHKLVDEFVDEFGIRTSSDWYVMNEKEIKFISDRCDKRAIKCPRGSLVVWDSRLVHCGMGVLEERDRPNFRCINYLSYMPRSSALESVIEKRINGFENLLTSNHYANRATFFQSGQEDYITKIDKPILTELGKRLVGMSNDVRHH